MISLFANLGFALCLRERFAFTLGEKVARRKHLFGERGDPFLFGVLGGVFLGETILAGV